MTVPAAILELIARFAEHRETYRSPTYKEAQVRIEFLNPVAKKPSVSVERAVGPA